MIIKEIDLDSLAKDEYLAFIQTLLNYFYVQYDEEYIMVKGSDDDE